MYKSTKIALFLKGAVKARKAFIESKEGRYYISDSYAIYRVNDEKNFEKVSREVIPFLPKEGQTLQYIREEEPHECNIKIYDLLCDFTKRKKNEVKPLPLLAEFSPRFTESSLRSSYLQEKYAQARVFRVLETGEIILIPLKHLEVFQDLENLVFYYISPTDPLLFFTHHNDDDAVGAIMPLDKKNVEVFKETVKSFALE